jgi:hypothetical protein
MPAPTTAMSAQTFGRPGAVYGLAGLDGVTWVGGLQGNESDMDRGDGLVGMGIVMMRHCLAVLPFRIRDGVFRTMIRHCRRA